MLRDVPSENSAAEDVVGRLFAVCAKDFIARPDVISWLASRADLVAGHLIVLIGIHQEIVSLSNDSKETKKNKRDVESD